jgi:tetratricopeptide (TPR) repeat protein
VAPIASRSTRANRLLPLAALAAFPLALAILPHTIQSAETGPSVDPDHDAGRAYEETLALYRAGRIRDALERIRRATIEGAATAGLHALAGWCHLREGNTNRAEGAFRAALALKEKAIEPRVGLGYIMLRRGAPRQAAQEFSAVLEREPENLDGLKGLGLARRDQQQFGEAIVLFRRALDLAPDDPEARKFLDRALSATGDAKEVRPRPPVDPRTPLHIVARASERRFRISEDGRELYVKGVNFGVALPGRFPSEFPQERSTYLEWLESVSEMGANTVRLYTLLPPTFYDALADHNRRHPRRRLWLVQGVWTELPERHDYGAPAFLRGLQEEIRRVIDAVHGNLDLPARAGHASGAFREDVSSSVLAYLLGREWEPFSVEAYDRARASRRKDAAGAFVRVTADASPFEAWLADLLDFTVRYETERYRQQRPVSFVSWPTLDPLHHPTEATVAEEIELLRRRGEAAGAGRIAEYDNDGVTVDTTHLMSTAAAGGGIFATYHAYPYYPDFMNLDPAYNRARDGRGGSGYNEYLRDLARHHGAQPILIAEFGVPSSRGVAHLNPDGWDHGGHSERRQGQIDGRLIRDIHEAGMAGGILFSLLDEWFKRNWVVTDLEIPRERNRLWLNMLDPEQNYGVLATRPGESGWRVVIDGRGNDWSAIPPLSGRTVGGPEHAMRDGHDAARTLRSLSATSDEAYLYLRLEVENLDADSDGAPDWDHVSYVIGIDTYDDDRGDHRMPLADLVRSPVGLEFCLIFDGEHSSRLLIDPPYDVALHRGQRIHHSVRNEDGRFTAIWVETNRRRIGRDGTSYPAQGYSRSPLLHASMDPRDPDHDTLADWHANVAGSFIEARIAWGLLNVTDPSSRRVLHDDPSRPGSIGTQVTAGFRFYMASIRPDDPPGQETPVRGRLADRLPRGEVRSAAELPFYSWEGWDRPSYRIERKESWSIVKEAFDSIPAAGRAR